MITGFAIYSWLLALTVAEILTAALFWSLRRRFTTLDQREIDLDNAERMQRLMDLLTRNQQVHDREIRRAVEVLIAGLEQDPRSREQHWLNIQHLRAKLAQT